MKTRILIPIDGSQFSEQVVTQVKTFFPPTECELILLRVGEPVYSSSAAQAELMRDANIFSTNMHQISEREFASATHPIYATQIEVNERAALEGSLLALAQSLRDVGYTVSTHIEFGEPAKMITHLIERDHIDLIAMTTHGRTGLSRALFGSVAESVLHHVQIPIFLFRPE